MSVKRANRLEQRARELRVLEMMVALPKWKALVAAIRAEFGVSERQAGRYINGARTLAVECAGYPRVARLSQRIDDALMNRRRELQERGDLAGAMRVLDVFARFHRLY